MSKLECKDFTVKYFGHDAAVSGVTTEFSNGINVIFAAEKGGKTSFLKALAGIVSYQGELFLDGVDLSTVPLKERDFQMLFDDYALFSRRCARYNLEYPLKLRKVPKSERKKAVEDAAALFDLDVMIDAPVYRLNDWHKVCLVLCRAYIRRAKVLLIDNIFSKLDLQSRREAFYRFMPLLSPNGIVIYATDSVEEASALPCPIKLLSCGYLLQEGSASDLCSTPSCLAAFAAFGTYASALPVNLEQGGINAFCTFFSIPGLSLISDDYIGKTAIVGLSLNDTVMGEGGVLMTVKGFFLQDGKTVCMLEKDGNIVFCYANKDPKIGEEVTLSIRSVTGVFDALNQRAIVRYK